MKSVRILLLCCICLGVCVLLDASPAHAAVESAGLFDRVTEHFRNSLTKWGDTMTTAATALFWMLATIAFCWEFGNLALRGGSMEAALAYVLRFVLIEGIWLYILQNAVPIGTAIIDSLRHLGSTASGLPRDLMPSAVLDVGFGVLWKAIVFVGKNTFKAPIVSFCALIMALLILLACATTAINMVVLIVSQWFLLYGGVFFLGFGGAPWTSDKARNYLLLALSVGAQLLGMAGVVGLGQSFMQDQYAQMSGDTAFGELAVILIVALLVCILSNEIPKLFARFAPGYTPQGIGIATVLGATATAAAVVAASAAMARGAMESVAGVARAVNAAHSAAKAQSSRPASTARSQTGVSSSRLGSNGTSTTGSGDRASTQTQGPLGAMFGGNGIGIGNARSGPGERSAASSRSSTQASPIEQHGSAASKSTSKPSAPSTADDKQASEGTDAELTAGAGADSPSQTLRASTQTEAQAQNSQGASEHEQETSEAHSDTGSAQHEEEAPTGSGAESDHDHDDDHEEAEASQASEAHNDTDSAEDEASATDESERAQNASTGSDSSRLQSDDDEGAMAASERAEARSEPAGAHADSSVAPIGGGESSAEASSTPASHGSGSATAAPAAAAATGAADTAHASPTAQTQPSSAAHTPSTPTSSSTSATDTGATQKKAATTSSTTGSGAPDSTTAKSSPAPASKASSDVEGAAASAASSPASDSGSAALEPSETPGTAGGGARGSTSIGTIAAATKILGGQTLQHYKGRFTKAKNAFHARADQTVGGRIAQAIRKEYNLDPPPKDATATESRPLRSHTGAGKPVGSETHAAGPRDPADWVTGDDPMTENQYFFLSSRLGADLDPNMTKAEASILIDEMIDDER